MRQFGIILAAAAAVAALAATPAQAQSNRTFVSGNGDDGNPCTNTFPCRTFSFALTQTNAGGEITTMDAAGYGLVTIDKAISITNDGAGEAGISTGSAVNGITVSAGVNDVVNLRGLTLIGNAVGTVVAVIALRIPHALASGRCGGRRCVGRGGEQRQHHQRRTANSVY